MKKKLLIPAIALCAVAAAAAGVLACGGAGIIAGRIGSPSRPGKKGPGDR